MGEEKADPGPGVSRRNPLSRYVRGRGRRETGLKQSRRCTAGDRVPGAKQYQYQYRSHGGRVVREARLKERGEFLHVNLRS